MTLAGEVKACPDVAAGTAHPMRVTVTDNGVISVNMLPFKCLREVMYYTVLAGNSHWV